MMLYREPLAWSPKPVLYCPGFVARGDFTDLMGRAAYGRPGVRLGVTV